MKYSKADLLAKVLFLERRLDRTEARLNKHLDEHSMSSLTAKLEAPAKDNTIEEMQKRIDALESLLHRLVCDFLPSRMDAMELRIFMMEDANGRPVDNSWARPNVLEVDGCADRFVAIVESKPYLRGRQKPWLDEKFLTKMAELKAR